MKRPRAQLAAHGPALTVFVLTAFVAATLLFLVQPLTARLLLPSYGGSATVWSTASLFFQCALLLGYVYADRTVSVLGARTQRLLHVAVLLIPLAVLPLALPSDAVPPPDESPVLWLLRTLLVMVGLPFLVLATTGPLVQRWYSHSGWPRASDPYFLFAASNLGSFVGLLSYPFLIEPFVPLETQLRAWSAAFLVFVVLVSTCAVMSGTAVRAVPRSPTHVEDGEQLTPVRQLRWCGWAFLPSALMLSVTSYLSTDVAPIPLLWVLPLAIYLATFVAAFARQSRRPPVSATRLAVAVATAAVVSSSGAKLAPVLVAIPLQLAMLALVAFAAHARLSADRPTARHLTRFYLVVAVGGALGGLLNGVVAPMVFDRVIEHGLLLTCVPLLLIGAADRAVGLDGRARTAVLAVTVLGLSVLATLTAINGHLPTHTLATLLLLGLVGLLGWVATSYRLVVLGGLVVLQVATLWFSSADVIDRERTFYGSYQVLEHDGMRELRHGTTTHGTEFLDPSSRDLPTAYYSHSGPLGDLFGRLEDRDRVAVVGLGAGTVASYGRPDDQFTFFEIDRAVADLATTYFHYVADSAADTEIRIGDGRLGLAAERDGRFDMIVLDAFSSDAIPTHLLTREAFRIYAGRLRPGGVLAVHISNRVFDLRPLLRGEADDLGWPAVVGERPGEEPGAYGSIWVVLSKDERLVQGLTHQRGWGPLPRRSVLWTDDYSSVLRLLGGGSVTESGEGPLPGRSPDPRGRPPVPALHGPGEATGGQPPDGR